MTAIKGNVLSSARELRGSNIPARPWHDPDRAYLRRMVTAGQDSIHCARKLQRSRADVLAEIERLGMNRDYEPDPLEVAKVMRPCLSCGKEFLTRTGNICPDCKERVEFRSSAADPAGLHLEFHKRGR